MTTTTIAPEADTQCRRCHRPLRAQPSVAAQHGPECLRLLKDAAAHVAAHDNYTAAQLHKAVKLIAGNGIRRDIGARFVATSTTTGQTYLVYAIPGTCTCPAGQHGTPCYHVAAAKILTLAA